MKLDRYKPSTNRDAVKLVRRNVETCQGQPCLGNLRQAGAAISLAFLAVTCAIGASNVLVAQPPTGIRIPDDFVVEPIPSVDRTDQKKSLPNATRVDANVSGSAQPSPVTPSATLEIGRQSSTPITSAAQSKTANTANTKTTNAALLADETQRTRSSNQKTNIATGRANTASDDAHDSATPLGPNRATEPSEPVKQPVVSDPRAIKFVQQVIDRMANGPAFDALVRQRVWTSGREVIGVGAYVQTGGGTGRFNLQITMHDGDGKHSLQQISDGRLAWTRSEIAEDVSLRRVDISRLDEWLRGSDRSSPTRPGLRVGGFTEMLDQVLRDFDVQLASGKLDVRDADGNPITKPVLVVTGTLTPQARERLLQVSGQSEWPLLCPVKVRIAVAARATSSDDVTEGLPLRIEYWSEPVATKAATETEAEIREGRLITLIELYSIRQITPPPIEHFRFENHDSEVNFVNETERYLERYGAKLTELQRRHSRR